MAVIERSINKIDTALESRMDSAGVSDISFAVPSPQVRADAEAGDENILRLAIEADTVLTIASRKSPRSFPCRVPHQSGLFADRVNDKPESLGVFPFPACPV